MNNRFEVLNVRYKLDDFSVLMIEGWFCNNKSEDATLEAWLDGEKLCLEMEEHSSTFVIGKNLNHKRIIDTIYFCWIKLPGNFKEKESLTLKRVENGKSHKVKTFRVAEIAEMKKGMAGNVDYAGLDKEIPIIQGWFACPQEATVRVYNLKKEEVQIEIKQKKRIDVLDEFPEAAAENVLGYEIKLLNCTEKKVQLVIQYGKKRYKKICVIRRNQLEKVFSKTKEIVRKGLVYYKKNGLNETVVRCYEKVTNKKDTKYQTWRIRYGVTQNELNEQRKKIFEYVPKISIVIPLYKTPEKYLRELIASVQNQTYENWELCFSDGSGVETSLRSVVSEYQKKDTRIKIVCSENPMQISENTNAAIAMATGEFIAFADHDDLLTPNALYENVCVLNENADIDFIYSDEDKISMDGKEYFEPHFKPDFNMDLLRTTNYICHFVVVRKRVLEQAGVLRSEFDGAQDYDFVLRCVEQTENIYHIPKVLYHWRAHKDSTAENPESKMYAFEAGARAVKAHYERIGIDADVEMRRDFLGIYRSRFHLERNPVVSVIIPNKDHVEDLDKCLRSIEDKSTYNNIEYIIVENNSSLKKTYAYYEKIQQENERVKVVTWDGAFNYSAINNYGVKFAQGEYLLFLNNDTEIINEDCIEELLGYCMREDVGVVGARLYYPDDTIQHAGVIIGLGGIAGHCFSGMPKEGPGYFARAFCAQDYSAVTAACMMVKRDVFELLNGFDEELQVAFNDIDFCLRVRELGKKVVYNPYAELYHYESKSRGQDDTEEKADRFKRENDFMRERWNQILVKGDPYYNPNLSLVRGDFSLR